MCSDVCLLFSSERAFLINNVAICCTAPSQAKLVYLPHRLMFLLSHVSEWITWITRGTPNLGMLLLLTPATWDTAGKDYTFNDDKAKETLGYNPIFSVEHGIQRSLKLHAEARNRSKQEAALAADDADDATDVPEWSEEEAENLQAELGVPKSLRFNSPGRKATISIPVEGSRRRRKSPARFVAKS